MIMMKERKVINCFTSFGEQELRLEVIATVEDLKNPELNKSSRSNHFSTMQSARTKKSEEPGALLEFIKRLHRCFLHLHSLQLTEAGSFHIVTSTWKQNGLRVNRLILLK